MKRIKYWFIDFKIGINNILYFLPVVWKFRPWDYDFNKELLIKSLEKTSKHLRENGLSIDSEQSADEIDRAIEVLNKDFIDMLPSDESDINFEKTVIAYGFNLNTTTKWDRAFDKSELWHKARLSVLGKLFSNYTNWWD